MNVVDLGDPEATAAYLRRLPDEVSVVAAHALAQEALDFASPPAGAWTVLAHVAEHRGDYAGLERWTAAALDVDPDFAPSVADHDYLDDLRTGIGAGGPLRADRLLWKLDAFSGRMPQLRAQLDLAAEVLGTPTPVPTVAALDVADTWQFCAFLAFEGGLLRAFDEVAGSVLPAGERKLLRSWFDVRHRHVCMLEQRRRRWTLRDLATRETIVADTMIETWWENDREGFLVVAPVGSRLVVVGEPLLFDDEVSTEARIAVSELTADPLAVARTALRWRIDRDRRARAWICFPDVDPDTVSDDEIELLELVRRRRPDIARRADAGDPLANHDLLLEAITAHRIITRRTWHTWDIVQRLLSLGVSREAALNAAQEATAREIAERARDEEAA